MNVFHFSISRTRAKTILAAFFAKRLPGAKLYAPASMRMCCLCLAALTGLAPMAAGAQIPVTDAAQIANDNLMQNAMQQFFQNVVGKEYLQKTLSEDAIKTYLGDKVLKEQIGNKLLKPMLDQLSVQPGSPAMRSMLDKVVPGQMGENDRNFGELKTQTRSVLDGNLATGQALTEFFKTDTAPNCPASGSATPEMVNNCLAARNALSAQLKEIRNMSQSLEARNNALRDLLKESNYSSLAELQQKQYTMLTLQTIIANDNMRLQTALAAYQSMRAMYQEKHQEAVQERVTGKPASLVAQGGTARLLAAAQQAGLMQAGIVAGRAAAQQIGPNRIFKR